MTDKPEALRLADALEDPRMVVFLDQRTKAAAELRRLHAENERLKAHIVRWKNRMECELIPMAESLEAQRDALLEALHAMLSHTAMLDPSQGYDGFDHSAVNQARAAIARAEGSQK